MNFRKKVMTLAVFVFAAIIKSTVGQDQPTYACHEYPGVQYYCSSSCYPNCQDQFESYYNVMMVLPNKAECYINKETFGAFRVFLPTTGITTAEADPFILFNNVCQPDPDGGVTPVSKGTVYDGYFQCDNNLRLYVGGGNIPNAEITEEFQKRRVEIYTQTKLNICKNEFPLLYPADNSGGGETVEEEGGASGLFTSMAVLASALGLIGLF